MTALMKASESGHSSIVRELLDGGASVNLQDNVRIVRPTIVIFGITSSLHHTQLLATSLLI